jgi:hypothetical protein
MISVKTRKKSRKPKKVAESLRSRLAEHGLPNKVKFIRNARGQVKMSEVLSEFIEPYERMAKTEDAYNRLLSVAVVAWNAALLPDRQRHELITTMINAAKTPDADEAKLVIQELISRKDKYFPDIKRFIISYELTMTREGPHISVASTLE